MEVNSQSNHPELQVFISKKSQEMYAFLKKDRSSRQPNNYKLIDTMKSRQNIAFRRTEWKRGLIRDPEVLQLRMRRKSSK